MQDCPLSSCAHLHQHTCGPHDGGEADVGGERARKGAGAAPLQHDDERIWQEVLQLLPALVPQRPEFRLYAACVHVCM